MSQAQWDETCGGKTLCVLAVLPHILDDKKAGREGRLITLGEAEVVIGLHIHGDAADEMLQGFAVAVAAGLTMRDFNATMAIHPSSAEELVTFKPWQPRPAAAE